MADRHPLKGISQSHLRFCGSLLFPVAIEAGTTLTVAIPHIPWMLSASLDNTLKVWDVDTGSALPTLEGHSAGVYSVAVTADGRRAVSASEDHTLKVWDLETGSALRTLEGHSAGVHGVAVTADGRRAVSASYDKTLKLWDLETGTLLASRGRAPFAP